MPDLSRFVAGVGVVLALSIGAGCSGDDPDGARSAGDAPAALGSESPSSQVSAPPAPDLPDAAAVENVQGAKAFARHWVALLNHATLTGDVEALAAVDADCGTCGELAEAITGLYSGGGRVETTGWQVTKVLAEPNAAPRTAALQLSITRAPEAVFVRADAEAKPFTGGKEKYLMALKWQQGGWRISELANVAR